MADKQKERAAAPARKSRFASGMVVYAWVMLILIGLGLGIFYQYLTAYEASLPEHCVEACQESLRASVPAAAFRDLAMPGSLEQSEALKADFLAGLFREAELQKDLVNTREYHRIYRVKAADGQILGSVVFEPVDKGSFGLPEWEMVEEHYDFSSYYRSTGVVVPSDYRVFLDETELGSDCIRETGIPYESLAPLAEDYRLPFLVRYETPPFLGQPALRVLNEKGEELALEQLTEEVFLDRCPEEVSAKIEEFLPVFLDLYSHFSADIQNSARMYYNQLIPMVVPNSELHSRMDQAFEGFGYSATRDDELLGVETDRIVVLGNGRYAVELRYTEEITGSDREVGPVQRENHIFLVLLLSGEELLAEALYYL